MPTPRSQQSVFQILPFTTASPAVSAGHSYVVSIAPPIKITAIANNGLLSDWPYYQKPLPLTSAPTLLCPITCTQY